MKRFVAGITLSVIASMILLCACAPIVTAQVGSDDPVTEVAEPVVDMRYIGTSSGFSYYYDVVTDVMYITYKSGYAGGMTVMLESGGEPLTYTRYLELCAGKNNTTGEHIF